MPSWYSATVSSVAGAGSRRRGRASLNGHDPLLWGGGPWQGPPLPLLRDRTGQDSRTSPRFYALAADAPRRPASLRAGRRRAPPQRMPRGRRLARGRAQDAVASPTTSTGTSVGRHRESRRGRTCRSCTVVTTVVRASTAPSSAPARTRDRNSRRPCHARAAPVDGDAPATTRSTCGNASGSTGSPSAAARRWSPRRQALGRQAPGSRRRKHFACRRRGTATYTVLPSRSARRRTGRCGASGLHLSVRAPAIYAGRRPLGGLLGAGEVGDRSFQRQREAADPAAREQSPDRLAHRCCRPQTNWLDQPVSRYPPISTLSAA